MADGGLDINNIDIIVTYLEVAINRKAFKKEEVDVFFAQFNHTKATLDKMKRQIAMQEMYKND